MSTCPKHAVIVVDDNPRFPFSVWRAFSRVAEFGYGDGHRARGRFRAPHREGAPFKPKAVSPDGVFVLEWIDPIVECLSPVEWFVRRIEYWHGKSVRIWAIVDVRHRSARGLLEYKAAFLRCGGRIDDFVLMTSYRRPDGDEQAKSKDAESLNALRTRLYADAHSTSRGPAPVHSLGGEVAHVLVTGAGFELREHESAIGLPVTRQLLDETRVLGSNDHDGDVVDDERISGWKKTWDRSKPPMRCFPIPETNLLGGAERTQLRSAARARNLDLYWDVLLRAAHGRHEVNPSASLNDREDYKARAASIELRLRDGFRRSIAKYDIGQMTQSLAAAALPWDAWLTTNYTRFIDRAIDASGGNRSNWRLLQTPIEAEVFLNEQLARVVDRGHQRLAVKLHGDIGQVYTMAIAANDKEVLSPLYVRPMLYVMYGAATEALCGCLTQAARHARPTRPSECWWHIVGHGLCDRPLLALIRTVVSRTPAKHSFCIVAPQPEAAAKNLKEACPEVADSNIHVLHMSAQQYLLQLRRDRSALANPARGTPPPGSSSTPPDGAAVRSPPALVTEPD